MRLIGCSIKNFGSIKDLDIFFDRPLHMIYAENGWGKSTLAAFIKVMLYGFAGEERKVAGFERTLYRPWQGGSCQGSLTFSCKGKKYTVYRSFGHKKHEDSFQLYDADTNLPSGDFGEIPGEEIFGLDQRSFSNTVFFKQLGLQEQILPTDRINSKINDFIDNTNDLDSYEQAQKRLILALDSLTKKRNGKKALLDIELQTLEKSVREKPFLQNAINSAKEKFLQLEALEKDLRQRMQILTQESSLQSRNSQQLLRELQEKLRISTEEMSDSGFQFKNISLLFYFGLFIFLMSLLINETAGSAWKIFLAFGALSAAAGIFKTRSRQYEKLHKLRAGIDRIRHGITELEKEISCAAVDSTAVRDELQREYLELNQTKALTGQRLEELYQELDQCRENEEKLAHTAEEYSQVLQKIDDLTLTSELLADARQALTNRYKVPLQQKFLEYLRTIAPDEKLCCRLDAEGRIVIEAEGLPRDFPAFSCGQRDLLNFCLRLALLDAMFKKEKPFLLLDDPFVNLDDEKLDRARHLVEKLTEEYQIIYLTCSGERIL